MRVSLSLTVYLVPCCEGDSLHATGKFKLVEEFDAKTKENKINVPETPLFDSFSFVSPAAPYHFFANLPDPGTIKAPKVTFERGLTAFRQLRPGSGLLATTRRLRVYLLTSMCFARYRVLAGVEAEQVAHFHNPGPRVQDRSNARECLREEVGLGQQKVRARGEGRQKSRPSHDLNAHHRLIYSLERA